MKFPCTTAASILALSYHFESSLAFTPHPTTTTKSIHHHHHHHHATLKNHQSLSNKQQSETKLFLSKKCEGDNANANDNDTPALEPLKPFIPALDPMYKCRGVVGDGDFLLKREGGPVIEELSNDNLYKILMIECSDLEVNTLVWKCLGYRFDVEKEEWTNEEVFPKWKEKFPSPPDLIGMQRIYSKEVDNPSLKSNQQLVKSVPVDNKQSLKTHLKPLGFTGYKIAELTPNKTRRAQCANWLLFYREELFGYTVEELKERRRLKQEAAAAEKLRLEKENDGKNDEKKWTPPVTEVY